MASASVTPWNAPAIKGLSSGALQNTTSFAQPIESLSAVIIAVSFTILPISLTASILSPVFVEPKFTELQIKSVSFIACGIDSIRSLSASVIPFETMAEYPPKKFTPRSFAALSSVFAICTKSSFVLQALPPTKAIGVTDILLFTIGTPKSFDISSPTLTRSFAVFVILSYIFLQSLFRSLSIQSSKLIPIVIVLTSNRSLSIMSLVSITSNIFSIIPPRVCAWIQKFLLFELLSLLRSHPRVHPDPQQLL